MSKKELLRQIETLLKSNKYRRALTTTVVCMHADFKAENLPPRNKPKAKPAPHA